MRTYDLIEPNLIANQKIARVVDVLPDRNAHTRAKSPLYLMVDSVANIRSKVIG